MRLVLSVFPGIDLLGRAFEEEGYCVVRGPDLLWGGDVKSFQPPAGVFEGVVGGPPCQTFSKMRHLLKAWGKEPRQGNLIPEFERIVAEAQPVWFLMENVRDAPIPKVESYIVHDYLINHRWLGGIQHRIRRFSFGCLEDRELDIKVALFENPDWGHAVLADKREIPVRYLKGGKPKTITVLASDTPTPDDRKKGVGYMTLQQMCELQGLDKDFLKYNPFRIDAARELIGNGVPMLMGRAIAKAIRHSFKEIQLND